MPAGHDIVMMYTGRSHWIAVSCTCYPVTGRTILASGNILLARDAVAAWRQHLYDEGVIPREKGKDDPAVVRLHGSGAGGGLVRPADR